MHIGIFTIGDEVFASIKCIDIAVFHGIGLCSTRIRTGFRFSEAKSAYVFAPAKLGQVLFLLLLLSEIIYWRNAELIMCGNDNSR